MSGSVAAHVVGTYHATNHPRQLRQMDTIDREYSGKFGGKYQERMQGIALSIGAAELEQCFRFSKIGKTKDCRQRRHGL